MSLMSQISGLGLANDLARALVAVVRKHGPEVDLQSGYISVRPAEGHIAAYFNRNFVDIVVDPSKADGIAVRHQGTRVLPKRTSTTAYLHVPAGTLDEATVSSLLDDALAWREAGARWFGAADGPLGVDVAGETCQTCRLTIAKNGECDCD